MEKDTTVITPALEKTANEILKLPDFLQEALRLMLDLPMDQRHSIVQALALHRDAAQFICYLLSDYRYLPPANSKEKLASIHSLDQVGFSAYKVRVALEQEPAPQEAPADPLPSFDNQEG